MFVRNLCFRSDTMRMEILFLWYFCWFFNGILRPSPSMALELFLKRRARRHRIALSDTEFGAEFFLVMIFGKTT